MHFRVTYNSTKISGASLLAEATTWSNGYISLLLFLIALSAVTIDTLGNVSLNSMSAYCALNNKLILIVSPISGAPASNSKMSHSHPEL